MKITHLPFNGLFKVTWEFGAFSKSAGTKDNLHHGIDLVGKTSTDVYSTSEGIVTFVGFDSTGFGNYVKIKSGKYDIYFAHLASINVKFGQKVTYNTKLGVMGATGHADGAHLHYEIRMNGIPVNPCSWLGIPNKLGIYNSDDFMTDAITVPAYETYIIKIDKTRVRPQPNLSIFNKATRILGKGNEISVFGYVNGFLKTDIGYVHNSCAYKK